MLIFALLALDGLTAEAPRQSPPMLGYPLTVDLVEGRCKFLIQDMWMSDPTMVESWMTRLPDKSRRVDVVWQVNEDRACIAPAEVMLANSGFRNVVVRTGSPNDYPDLLRQTMPVVTTSLEAADDIFPHD